MKLLIKTIVTVICLAVQLPISLWLQYKMLRMLGATELMMFLYWINLPLIIGTSFIFKLLEEKTN